MIHQLRQETNEFNRLNKEIFDLYHDIYNKTKMSNSAFDVLYSIVALGNGCCQRDICNYAFTSKQTIHSAICKLESEDIIYMKPGKGREVQIFLTSKGEKIVTEKIIPVIDMENNVFEQMALEERNTLLQLTEKYLSFLRKQVKEGNFYTK